MHCDCNWHREIPHVTLYNGLPSVLFSRANRSHCCFLTLFFLFKIGISGSWEFRGDVQYCFSLVSVSISFLSALARQYRELQASSQLLASNQNTCLPASQPLGK